MRPKERARERSRDAGKDTKEKEKARLGMAYEQAKKITEKEHAQMKRAGFSDEQIRERLAGVSRTAGFLLANASDELDRLVAERKKRLEEMRESRQKGMQAERSSSSKLEGLADVAKGFKERIQEKKTSTESRETSDKKKEPKEKAETRKEDESKQREASDKRDVSTKDNKSERTVKDVFDGVRKLRKDPERKRMLKKTPSLYSRDELRYAYEKAHGQGPKIKIDSMKDVDRLSKKHPDAVSGFCSPKSHEQVKVFFKVREDWSKTQLELSKKYNIPQSTIGAWREGVEQRIVSKLRSCEEKRIIDEWTKSQLPEKICQAAKEYSESKLVPELKPFQLDFKGATKIGLEDVKESFDPNKKLDATKLTDGLRKIYGKKQSDSRICHSDLKEVYESEKIKAIEKVFTDNREAIELDLKKRLGLEDSDREPRVAFVEGRLYVWTRERTRDDMLNAWNKLYFYPQDKREFTRLTDRTLDSLGLDTKKSESRTHFNKLMDTILDKPESEKIRKSKHLNPNRFQGETLRFQMDTIGLETSYLEGKIKRITGFNGQGGIKHPKFIEGEQLTIARARMMATGLSDCHLQKWGRLAYYEEHKDRIERFETVLSQFGDFILNPRWIPKDGVFETKIPTPFGCALDYWGLPIGDKTILNPHMPEYIKREGNNVAAGYMEALISEEGHASRKGYNVSWNRTNLLDAAEKSKKYGFVSQIGPDVKDMIRKHGRGGYKEQKYLTITEIDNLSQSEDSTLSATAKSLIQAVENNRNHLLDDEVELPKKFGIKMDVRACYVRYYENSGRVSVYWEANTVGWEDAFRWGIVAPPNDARKREVVRSWFDRRPDDVQKVCEQLRGEGYDFEKWWNE